MSRDIIDWENDNYPLTVNTFWMGDCEGVQITLQDQYSSYTQLTRKKAIEFFRTALERLEAQVKADTKKAPWWQKLGKEAAQK